MVKVDASKARKMHDPRFGPYVLEMVDVEFHDSFDFKCIRCGSCCSRPPGINPKEASKLSEHLGISKVEFFNKYAEIHKNPQYGWKVKLGMKNEHCAFLKKDNKASCRVYEARPRQCCGRPLIGYFNYFLDETVEPELMNFKINPCQGFGKGPEYTVEEWIERNGLKEAWQDEVDYIRKINSMKSGKTSGQLMMDIIDLFIR